MSQFGYLCVAGTFDGLHAGHRALLERAFAEGTNVLIGLTSDAYVAREKQGNSRPYEIRLLELISWLTKKGWNNRSTIIALHDAVGPAGTDRALQAIVASEESVKGVEAVNLVRQHNRLPPLSLITVRMVHAEDKKPISSTRIREGIISPDGKLLLPDFLRDELAQPLGIVLNGSRIDESLKKHQSDLVITVGDRTTKTVRDSGIIPHLVIIDHKVNRIPYHDLDSFLETSTFVRERIKSGPGYISTHAMECIRRLMKGSAPAILDVDGEDDLLTLPAIIEAPLGAILYYGQPPVPSWACGPVTEGIVEVIITKEIQQTAHTLLQKFVLS